MTHQTWLVGNVGHYNDMVQGLHVAG